MVPTLGHESIAETLRRRDAAVRGGLEGITLRSLLHESLDGIPEQKEVSGELRRDH